MVFRSANIRPYYLCLYRPKYRCWRWCFGLIIIICLYTGVGDGVSV